MSTDKLRALSLRKPACVKPKLEDLFITSATPGNTCVYIYIYIYMYTYVLHTYNNMCIYIYIYIHTYMYTHNLFITSENARQREG